MMTAPLSRRDRLRQILADLRMPGALEALDAILHGVDGGRRPPDERYVSVQQLYDAARARRSGTEERITETVNLRVQAVAADALAIGDRHRQTSALTHWSFEQLAGLAGAPPAYLRTLPAPIAADAINYGLQRSARVEQQLFADANAPWTLHAITSPRYARVHHNELAGRVLDLMALHPSWHLPLAYKDGVMGAERVPSGAYLGDRDMFILLVDGNRDLDDPTDASHAGLFRGFMLRNSDVGAAALTLDMFLYRSGESVGGGCGSGAAKNVRVPQTTEQWIDLGVSFSCARIVVQRKVRPR